MGFLGTKKKPSSASTGLAANPGVKTTTKEIDIHNISPVVTEGRGDEASVSRERLQSAAKSVSSKKTSRSSSTSVVGKSDSSIQLDFNNRQASQRRKERLDRETLKRAGGNKDDVSNSPKSASKSVRSKSRGKPASARELDDDDRTAISRKSMARSKSVGRGRSTASSRINASRSRSLSLTKSSAKSVTTKKSRAKPAKSPAAAKSSPTPKGSKQQSKKIRSSSRSRKVAEDSFSDDDTDYYDTDYDATTYETNDDATNLSATSSRSRSFSLDDNDSKTDMGSIFSEDSTFMDSLCSRDVAAHSVGMKSTMGGKKETNPNHQAVVQVSEHGSVEKLLLQVCSNAHGLFCYIVYRIFSVYISLTLSFFPWNSAMQCFSK